MNCCACRSQPAAVGLLCEACSSDLGVPIGLLPQQILATIAKPTGDALIDQWGRAHPLEARTMLGRALEGTGIMILEASVSRHHAHLARDNDGWSLRDLGSSNGTFHNDTQITETAHLVHGDRVTLGSVGFLLACGLGEVPEVTVDPAVITTIRSVRRLGLEEPEQPTETDALGVPAFVEREDTDVGLPRMPLSLSEPKGGGGGLLELSGVSVQISANQLELLGLLARRMRDEADQPTQVRGFVRSSELVASISWETREPDENHLKQLVRRTRRLLVRSGLGDLIESRQRFGYRLKLIPTSL